MRASFSIRYADRVRGVRRFALVALLGCLVWSKSADARQRDVVLVGADAALHRAVENALVSWDLHVARVDDVPPSAAMPLAGREARLLARRYEATGVVWLVDSGEGHALFVYDAESDQVVTRALVRGPPFDPPSAAAAALSVKTLLRSSMVAPPSERLGAEARTPPEVEARTSERTDADLGARERPASPARINVELSGAARLIANTTDSRIGAGVSVFFGPRSRWGVGLAARGGLGVDVSAPRFQGTFRETSLSPSLRLQAPLSALVRVEPRMGMTLHGTSIEGVVADPPRVARESRIDGSVDVGGVIDFELARGVRVGLELEASYLLRYQRYLVQSDAAFELLAIQGSLGLRLALGLP